MNECQQVSRWGGIIWLQILFFIVSIYGSSALAREKKIIGVVEQIKLSKYHVYAVATIDTGAKHSSINAPNYQIFHKNNKPWVKFTYVNIRGDRIKLEHKIERIAKIKRKGAPAEERPVIIIGICVADIYKEVEVNLVNRNNFKYQVLVGRSFLKDDFLVDSSRKNTVLPTCEIP